MRVSYDRLRSQYASCYPTARLRWASPENLRTASGPGSRNGRPAARRLEHRVPGGDTNPYLVLAVILGGMELGLVDGMVPPAPLTGNAYEQDLPQIPTTWDAAVTRFATSDLMERLLPARLIDNFTRTKRQEIKTLAQLEPQALLALYLDSV